MKEKIAVFYGGNSVEHEISIISALQVIKALNKEKYEVYPLYLTKDNQIYYGKFLEDLNNYQDYPKLKRECIKVLLKRNNNETYFVSDELKYIKKRIDVIIPVFHGKNVEDGSMSSWLDFLDVPYTSSSLTSASICQDKVFTKMILNDNHFNILEYEYYYKHTFDSKKVNINYPIIVKPSTLGSSIAINVANNKEELEDYVNLAFTYDKKVLLEKALENFQEFNCSAYRYKEEIFTSPVEEVIKEEKILSYEDKYLKGSMAEAKRVLPAIIKKELEEVIKSVTKQAYELLECQGVVRIDFLYDTKKKDLYLNEINSIPGSLSFYLWEEVDLRFDRLLDLLIEQAKNDYKDKKALKTNFDNMKILKNIHLNK